MQEMTPKTSKNHGSNTLPVRKSDLRIVCAGRASQPSEFQRETAPMPPMEDTGERDLAVTAVTGHPGNLCKVAIAVTGAT